VINSLKSKYSEGKRNLQIITKVVKQNTILIVKRKTIPAQLYVQHCWSKKNVLGWKNYWFILFSHNTHIIQGEAITWWIYLEQVQSIIRFSLAHLASKMITLQEKNNTCQGLNWITLLNFFSFKQVYFVCGDSVK
jgi:hypothetical protein